MHLKIFLIEDALYRNFYPLAYNRPVAELLFGATKIREKISFHYPKAEVRLICREHLQDALAAKTCLKLNDFTTAQDDRVLVLNGRVIPDESLIAHLDLKKDQAYWQGDILVAATLSSALFTRYLHLFKYAPEPAQQAELKANLAPGKVAAHFVNYPWDLIAQNREQIAKDFPWLKKAVKKPSQKSKIDPKAAFYNRGQILIGGNVRIEAMVVLNAESGPIYIDDNCLLQAFTRIEGPAYVGKDGIVYGAKISGGCSFGPHSRIGGEVQSSIFQGYSNKYHDGFVGHSYVGEWVNLGAGTTTSDLKNNYSNIRVTLPDGSVETGLNKIGTLFGDHVKTGIGTFLNSGTYLGIGANIFSGGMLPQKFIPSFAWGSKDKLAEHTWEKFIATAKIALSRRGSNLSSVEEELLKKIFNLTKSERSSF